jgi:short-subunit dehydrogenase
MEETELKALGSQAGLPSSQAGALECAGLPSPRSGTLAAAANRIAAWLGFTTAPQDLFRDKTALVTGASSGIGAVFAEELAKKGTHLVLAARSGDKLAATAARLQATYRVKVDTVAVDLGTLEGPSNLVAAIAAKGLRIDILINNAGAAAYGRFEAVPLSTSLGFLNLNVSTAVQLTHAFLGDMRERRDGCIVNVASIGATLPMPYMATYAGTKAFLNHFTECLWAENQGSGVRILSLCPGPTETAWAKTAHVHADRMGSTVEEPEGVVRRAFEGLAKNVPSIVTSKRTAARMMFLSLLPNSLLLRESEKVFRGIDARS